MVAAGVLISVVIELNAVYRVEKWGYGTIMPIIPTLRVGIFPVLQMITLPPLIFFLGYRRSWSADR